MCESPNTRTPRAAQSTAAPVGSVCVPGKPGGTPGPVGSGSASLGLCLPAVGAHCRRSRAPTVYDFLLESSGTVWTLVLGRGRFVALRLHRKFVNIVLFDPIGWVLRDERHLEAERLIGVDITG